MTSVGEIKPEATEEEKSSIQDSSNSPIKVNSANNRVNIESLTEPASATATLPDPQESTPEREVSEQTETGGSQRLLQLAAGEAGQTVIMLALLGLTLFFQFQEQLWLIEAALVVWLTRTLILATTRTNSLGLNRKIRTDLSQLAAEEITIGVWFMAAAYLLGWPPSGFDGLLFVAANLVAQGAVAIILRETVINETDQKFSWPTSKTSSIIIVGSGATAQKIADKILEQTDMGIEIRGFIDSSRRGLWRYRDIPLLGQLDDLENVVADNQVDLLLIANEPDNTFAIDKLFESAETMGLPIALLSDQIQPKIAKAQTRSFAGLPVRLYHSAPQNKITLGLKSMLDRTLALLGLIMISPVLLLTAILIKTESKGPVFFKQIRSGLNGKPFKIYKFRTMCADAEAQKASLAGQNEMSGPVFKIKEDPRITRLGWYLRKYSVDELPQFINVVRGEMSLVGPRPPLPKEVAGMEPWQRRKLSVLPGVTCTWQVSGRNAVDFEEWMRLDLDYIDNWSLWSDIKLIARTIPTVIKGSGS